MLDQPTNRFTFKKLWPLYDPNNAMEWNVNLPPSITVAAGQPLVPVSGGTINDVQTITIGGTATGGTWTPIINLDGNALSAAAVAYNVTGANLQTALQAVVGASNVTVTGNGPYTVTFVGALAGRPMAPITYINNITTAGTITVVHTTTGQSAGTYTPYTGSGTPTCLNSYDCATDAGGRITKGSAATGGLFGEWSYCTSAYYAGTFATADCPNMDAGAVTALGKLISGTAANGILRIG